MPRHPGLFISVEGIDGAGKSTHLPLISSILSEEGYKVISTREPGGTATGNWLRQFILEHSLSPESELLLMFAARKEHIREVIQPALAAHHCVVCDRFTDSSYAYQGGGRGVDDSVIEYLEGWVQQGLSPHLTLYFDLPVELSIQRRALRNQGQESITDRFEEESASFFKRVRQAYLDRIKVEPQRFYVIDGSESIEAIQEKLRTFLKEWLGYFIQNAWVVTES
jgi:dTMP kinase